MITRAQATRLKMLITQHAHAAIAESWKGAGPLDEAEEFEEELARTKKKIDDYIEWMVDTSRKK